MCNTRKITPEKIALSLWIFMHFQKFFFCWNADHAVQRIFGSELQNKIFSAQKSNIVSFYAQSSRSKRTLHENARTTAIVWAIKEIFDRFLQNVILLESWNSPKNIFWFQSFFFTGTKFVCFFNFNNNKPIKLFYDLNTGWCICKVVAQLLWKSG